ncbi:MAG: hypothetical protein H0V17_08145 [Deltaproteobacteria bacterium]|nr:hypothetical protein [Deltaproteobacteria bacterium]
MRFGIAVVLLFAVSRDVAGDPSKHEVTLAQAKQILPDAPAACSDIPCLISAMYAKDPKARDLALALYRENGSVAGVGPEEIMDGGYRGKIKLVPELPLARYRKHLELVSYSTKSIDEFFAKLFDKQPAPAYRWRGIQLRFVRSVGKRTPSAYAMGWMFAYNVEGSLMTSAAGVRETYFHELFHSNDGAHNNWSGKALRADYDAIVKKCPGVTIKCLTPYAPNDTTVRGGTFYAFQQNNGDGVHEYAAELAVRYWEEHMEILAKGKLAKKPFKCGPPENGRSWKALVDEFFGGRDLTPAC